MLFIGDFIDCCVLNVVKSNSLLDLFLYPVCSNLLFFIMYACFFVKNTIQSSSHSWPIGTRNSLVRFGNSKTVEAVLERCLFIISVPSCVARTVSPFGSCAIGLLDKNFMLVKNFQ